MAELSDFLPSVATEVPGCPEPTIERQLLHALQAFCRQSEAWRVTLDPVDSVAGQAEYILTAPADTEIVTILGVDHVDQTLEPTTEDGVLHLLGRAWREQAGPRARVFVVSDAARFRLAPYPNGTAAGGLLNIRVALQPANAAATLPDMFRARYLEGIASGALARLLAMRGRAWSDPAEALRHDAEFRAAIGQARKDLERGFARAVSRVRVRRLAGAP